jgi:hypothetical protein
MDQFPILQSLQMHFLVHGLLVKFKYVFKLKILKLVKTNATFDQDSFWWANAEGIYNDNNTFPGYNYWNDSDHTPMVYQQFSERKENVKTYFMFLNR